MKTHLLFRGTLTVPTRAVGLQDELAYTEPSGWQFADVTLSASRF